MGKIFVLELRPFGNFCDRNCSHCYQIKKEVLATCSLSFTLLQKLLIWLKLYLIIGEFTVLRVVFHGGEPMLDGGAWIKKAITTINNNISINNISYIIHSHGFHENNIFEELIKYHAGFGISLIPSINGFHEIPSGLMVTNKNNKLYSVQIVIREFMLKEISILSNTIKTLPKKVNIKLIPFIDPLSNQSLNPKKYGDLLIAISKELINLESWDELILEPIDWIRRMGKPNVLLHGCRFSSDCNYKQDTIVTIALDPDGTIYPCNRFAGIKKCVLGNLRSENWEKEIVFSMEYFNKIYRKQINFIRCKECYVFSAGGCIGSGGCPFHSLECFDTNITDPLCAGEERLLKFFKNSVYT
jgi:uncharacterized protein